MTKLEFVKKMEARYLSGDKGEGIDWLVNSPGLVLSDISLLIAEFKDTLYYLDNIMGEQ